MNYQYLSESVVIKKVSENDTEGVFEIEGLYAGYGLTIGNALRRVLFSSLPGAAITKIKIKNVEHQFSTLAGVLEDVVEISLNLKKIRFRIFSDEPQVLTLKAKGQSTVTAANIETNDQVELVTPEAHIATLTEKNSDLDMELTVEKGLGYVPVDARKDEKLAIGEIALDAMFSPVLKVNFSVENMRVGDRTDFNRLRLEVKTDGSLTPSSALRKSSNILQDHFAKISQVEVKEVEAKPEEEKKPKAKAKKTTAKKAKK